MSDAVLVALITGLLGPALVALITTGIRRRVKAIQGQVQNDHPTNLREELDDRHDETREWFRELRRDIGGLRQDLRGVRQDHSALAERVHRIEQREVDHD
ncbi:DUF2746 domain-containing protein [Microbacterium sp. XT11]|uniref:DUF2746 domain-containing protein n=1 Tax=Microbacterium sp. XT11 TaxID=367477 RepID=UPI0007430C91|nr:DUF2746 domain-containing protein [Microbacterium sp. XT11]ALX67451.1 hypothetical protein AB663_003405 [Microbacterium sp. XT11]